jgi:outer membrane protein assembly factor BamE (lipoprotein component of BamABCDE complex)
MNRTFTSVFLVFAALVLGGCAGTDFKRPDSKSLTLGHSTTRDVMAIMGEPRQTSEGLKNEQKVKSLHYAYAKSSGSAKYSGVTPAKVMLFTTSENVLVGQEFLSSFQEDATDFDDSKVQQISKGKTSKGDVVQLLGKPNGEAIYPMIKNKEDSAFVYSYSHVKGSVFNMKFYKQALVVSFDKNGIVSDVEYTSQGEK